MASEDMVVANYADKIAGVLLGNGDGTFQPQVVYHTSGNDSAIAVADFNGDGKPDLAVAFDHPEKVEILHGKGDGTFVKGTVGEQEKIVAKYPGDANYAGSKSKPALVTAP